VWRSAKGNSIGRPILHAAVDDGVKRYYIEDESPEAPQQVPVSKAYLNTVRY